MRSHAKNKIEFSLFILAAFILITASITKNLTATLTLFFLGAALTSGWIANMARTVWMSFEIQRKAAISGILFTFLTMLMVIIFY